MTAELEFYRDASGTPCAKGEDERLAIYLESELQGSVELAQEMIDRLNDPAFTGDIIGNGHCVDFRDNSVRIEAMHDEDAPDRVLSRDALLAQITAWLAFIR